MNNMILFMNAILLTKL